jgi:hypothetical protein
MSDVKTSKQVRNALLMPIVAAAVTTPVVVELKHAKPFEWNVQVQQLDPVISEAVASGGGSGSGSGSSILVA